MIDASIAAPLSVRVDKRVELLAIAMRLAGAKEYQVAAHAYAKEVDKTFGAFVKHPAIVRAAELRAKHGIGFDAPMQLAVHLDDDLNLVNGDELPTIDRRWNGVDIAAYVELLRTFAADAKLDAFFASHRATYDKAEAAVRSIITHDPTPFYEGLFGDHGKQTVVPGMLLGTNNVGVRNGNDFYQILSTPTLPLLVHEMAHSYINPAFANHHAALEPAGKALYPLFADAMRAQNYVDWQTMFNEAGVRALTVLFMRQTHGDVVGASAARDELRASFVWTNELAELFRKYQRDRGRYASFDAFMPQVIAFFDGLVKQYGGVPPKVPFVGPFDAVLRRDYVLALAPGPAADYTKTLAFFATKRVVDPAMKVEPGIGIVAYGTPKTNALIAQIAELAQWKITPERIELGGKSFAGTDLVLIATWYRGDDPTCGVAIYAAADESDLVGINSIRHGSRDWLVARRSAKGYEVVETGDWPVENGGWVAFPAVK